MDFFSSTFICLAILIATNFNDLFDTGVIETLVIANFPKLHLSMKY